MNFFKRPNHGLLMMVMVCLLLGMGTAVQAQPPYNSISSTFDYVWPDDPSSFSRVEWLGIQNHELIDNGQNNDTSIQPVHVFEAFYHDDIVIRMYVHSDYGNRAQATDAANRFGFILGQVPHELREGINDYAYTHLFGGSYWGSSGRITVNGLQEGSSRHEEKIISALIHASINNGPDPVGFQAARVADNGNFITDRAMMNVAGLDMNHSFAAWLLVRYYTDRISVWDQLTIRGTIPNRLDYFDEQQYKMHPSDNIFLQDAQFGFAKVSGDFNGDGYQDLAVGSPSAEIDGFIIGGKVDIFYGSEDGLSAVSDQVWHQDSPGIIGQAENGDQFGYSLAVGDFGNDRSDDLAIGAPGEDIGSIADAGSINILYGSPNGLSATGNQLWHQNTTGILGVSEQGDRFGHSLAAGNFGRGGRDDVAVGVPGEDIGSVIDAGSVNILYGSGNGLRANNNSNWHQGLFGMVGTLEAGDEFGSALAVGNFGRGTQDDLAIGLPGEDVGSAINAGAVQIMYGSLNGIRANNNHVLHQDLSGITEQAETNDRFGSVLAAGNFGRGARDDLAIGVPGEDIFTLVDVGVVSVIYGGSNGLSADESALWSQESNGIIGNGEARDRFGASFAVGHFNDDLEADLAIGVPGENSDSGAVNVMYGSPFGLVNVDNQIWTLNLARVAFTGAISDQFGYALAAGDFSGTGNDGLAVGIPFRDLEGSTDNGMGSIIYGSPQGLTNASNHAVFGLDIIE